MLIVPLLLAAATSIVPPTPAPPPVLPLRSPVIAPASIDNGLEVTGEALAAQRLRQRMFIDVRVNDSGPRRFLVDSGADRSVVSEGLAAELALPAGDPVRIQSMAGILDVPTVEVASLWLGKSEVGPITAPALAARYLGAEGLIGIDALADQRLMLDFVSRTITVQDSRRPYAGTNGEIVVTARRRNGQLIITQASIENRDVSAVIDTGSEVTLGNRALRRRLFGTNRPVGMFNVDLQAVTGQILNAEAIVVNNVRIGGLLLNNVVVAFAEAPPFAMFGLSEQPAIFLGSDLLASFRRVSLDFRNKKVRFTLR